MSFDGFNNLIHNDEHKSNKLEGLFNGSYNLQEEIEKAYKAGARDAFYSDLAEEYFIDGDIEPVEVEVFIDKKCNEYMNVEA